MLPAAVLWHEPEVIPHFLSASRNLALQAVKGPCNLSLEKAQLTVYNLKPLHFPVLCFTLPAFSRELRV